MKKILSLLLLICIVLPTSAGEIITGKIRFMDQPAADDTLTVNGVTRTWKSSPSGSGQIQLGANTTASATNLYNHTVSYPYTGPLFVGYEIDTEHVVTLRTVVDGSLSISATASGATWYSITYETNTTGGEISVSVPLSAASEAVRTNVASMLVTGLNDYAQNSLSETATATANLVNLGQAQTVTGVKIFTGDSIFRGESQRWEDGTITNTTLRQATIPDETSYAGIWFGRFGGDPLYAIGSEDTGAGIPSIYTLDASGNFSGVPSFAPAAENILVAGMADNRYGQLAAANTWTDQNTFSGGIAGSTLTTSTLSGGTLSGETTSSGGIRWQRVNHSSMANGNNAAVDFGEKHFVKVVAGPTAAFAVCGITGGENGRAYWVYNDTGQNMTLAHESGVEPTAANRLHTMTGADVATVGNGAAYLIYDSEDQRWVVLHLEP